jgi:hypothetical protein
VPEGCTVGSEFSVEYEGRAFQVTVPAGCEPFELLEVEIPQAKEAAPQTQQQQQQEQLVQVCVPDGCQVGCDFAVEFHGQSFMVAVPEGCGPGSLREIEVPCTAQPTTPNEVASSPSPTPTQTPMPTPTPSSHTPSSNQGAVAGEPVEPPLQPPELSDNSDDDSDDGGAKFGPGAPVEVLRTDGLWTLARVESYDAGGGTYTVVLQDGRFKYFVDEEDLRIPRFLLLSTANI